MTRRTSWGPAATAGPAAKGSIGALGRAGPAGWAKGGAATSGPPNGSFGAATPGAAIGGATTGGATAAGGATTGAGAPGAGAAAPPTFGAAIGGAPGVFGEIVRPSR